MTNWVDKQCNATIWLTPDVLLNPIRAYFGGEIPLDAATEPNNPTKANSFFTKEDNGLEKPWELPTFVNPPYGKILREWCIKINKEAINNREIVALMPCGSGRPGTTYWQDYILTPRLKSICYVRGRISFKRPDGTVARNNTYPSHLLGFNINRTKFKECFSRLGKVLEVCIEG